MRSFDVEHSFQLENQSNRPHYPPERANAVLVTAVVPVQNTVGVDVADVTSHQRIAWRIKFGQLFRQARIIYLIS